MNYTHLSVRGLILGAKLCTWVNKHLSLRNIYFNDQLEANKSKNLCCHLFSWVVLRNNNCHIILFPLYSLAHQTTLVPSKPTQ